MRKIAFLLFDQFQILDVTGPAQVLSSANELAPGGVYDIHYLSLVGGPCRATCGMMIDTEPFRDLTGFDSLIISGGDGSRKAATDPITVQYLKQEAPKLRRLISICTGAFLLAAAGLVDGKTITTHWAYATQLQKKNPRVTVNPDALYIRQGAIITSAGVTAGMDLALALVEEDQGRQAATTIARHLVIFYRRPGGQSQFSAFQIAQETKTKDFADLCLQIMTHPNRDYRIPQMAEDAHMTERTFIRHFTRAVGLSPGKFVEKARLENARRALAETRLNLDQIAHQCGYSSPEILRRNFQRHMAVSPSEYRQRFGI
ncbi:GlxA family transcriptional regulator [Paremcibacter congregatus]|uniref:GlxA family transcriptional regulator n=1 Tax=Paremcibacter congregatus TaxID=2043170 RepID=UPI003A93E442